MLSSRGQTLLELVIVMAVIVIIVAALVFATIFSIRNAQFSKNQAQATKLAQEGLERVRAGRDRNTCINTLPPPTVKSWNGESTDVACSGPESIWAYQVTGTCATLPSYCFFNMTNQGVLNYISTFTPGAKFVPDNAETVGIFKRAVIITDDAATFGSRKTVIVIVTWSDFIGNHQSRLTTILRKI